MLLRQGDLLITWDLRSVYFNDPVRHPYGPTEWESLPDEPRPLLDVEREGEIGSRVVEVYTRYPVVEV